MLGRLLRLLDEDAPAERAPYGLGRDTIVDPQVRRTWQIGAERVRISGKHWERTLQTILARVADGLGVAEPIAAELYKLLVYDKGSFFVSHRDTEKAPGMFATPVIVPPSTSSGGELVVRHRGRDARLDLRCEDPSEAAFAAFYADCLHEVLPVTSGCRLALVYNLLCKGKRARAAAPQL
jgi:predicted 2-oxoglutarate/Fe(II)-dependent dioxygenase YbiX